MTADVTVAYTSDKVDAFKMAVAASVVVTGTPMANATVTAVAPKGRDRVSITLRNANNTQLGLVNGTMQITWANTSFGYAVDVSRLGKKTTNEKNNK